MNQEQRRQFLEQVRQNMVEARHEVAVAGPREEPIRRTYYQPAEPEPDDNGLGLVYKTMEEQPQPTSTWDDIDARIAQAIQVERTFMVETIGLALRDTLDEERKASKDELTEEVRRLWAIIGDLQATLAALLRLDNAGALPTVESLRNLPRGNKAN